MNCKAADDRLTILLPLKGRDLHTLRFLYHADRTHLPFRILIADGWVNPRLADLLEQRADLFPNLRYRYVRFPNDNSLGDFYRKMAGAAALVTTPYVMQADNDDFLCAEGLERSLAFLERERDYVSCGGSVPGFTTRAQNGPLNNVVGDVIRWDHTYSSHHLPHDIGLATASQRVLAGFRDFYSPYYNVFRTPALQTILTEIAELEFQDMGMHEHYSSMRAFTLGKVKSGPDIVAYARQRGTTIRLIFGETSDTQRFLRPSFVKEYNSMVEAVVRACEAAGDRPGPELGNRIKDIYEGHMRRYIALHFVRDSAFRRLIAPLIPAWLKRLRNHGQVTAAGMRKAMVQQLRQDGADAAYAETFSWELDAIDKVLGGPDFPGFIQMHAPFLLEISQ